MVQVMLLCGALFSLLLGTFVILNNTKGFLFRSFFVLTLCAAAWLAVNGLITDGPITLRGETLLYTSRLITPLSLAASYALLNFFVVFKRRSRVWIYITTAIPAAFVSGFSLSAANVYVSRGELTLGWLFPFFIVAIVYINALSLFFLFGRDIEHSRNTRRDLQLLYLRLGFIVAILPAIGLGVILPLFSSSAISNLGPLCSILFLLFVTVAIIRNRLFDVRFALARTMGYLAALAFIAFVYGSALFLLSSLSFFSERPVAIQRFAYIALSLLTALIFPWTRRFFAKITDKIFYQDNYDPQALLDQLNKAIVSTIDLKKLLDASADIIARTMKLDYCTFLIKGSGRLVHLRKFGIAATAVEEHIAALTGAGIPSDELIIADYLPEQADRLKQLLYKDEIAALRELSTGGATTENGRYRFGYVVLGQKKSGNMYTAQDARLLEIIANELVVAIQNALRFEQIQNFNITLQQKVDEATKSLRRANARLVELDETKDDFISMASHQLRTPLTSVKGYLSMVLEGDAGRLTSQQTKMLRQAFSSSQRMVYLITDLLNISRLKTGKFVIDAAPADLSTIVHDEVTQLTESARLKEIELSYQKPANFPHLMLDETKIRQVIMNFIDNAIYYTPLGGHVRVELEEKPAVIELRIIDDGMGVPRAEQPHLFTKFYRAGNARKIRPDGTGLGLFMAKKVVTAQGGSIIFSSREGHGSTFGFMFSKTKLKVPDAGAVPTESTLKTKSKLPLVS